MQIAGQTRDKIAAMNHPSSLVSTSTASKPSLVAERPADPYTQTKLQLPTTLGQGPDAFQDPDVLHFIQHGWLVIDDVLNAATITDLRLALDELVKRRPGQELIHALLEEDDRFAVLLEVPAVMRRLHAILGEWLQLHSATTRIAPPGTRDQHWHRDFPWAVDPIGIPHGGIPSQIVCGYYLDVDPGSGPFICIPGSQRGGKNPPAGSTNRHPEELRLFPRPGQAVLFDSDMWHRGGAHLGSAPRRVCLMSYQHAWTKSREKFDGPKVKRLREQGSSRTRLLLGEMTSW